MSQLVALTIAQRPLRAGTSIMPTRRTVLQSAAALSAAPLAPNVVFAGSDRAAAQMSVLYDHRHREARDFRFRAAHLHAPISGTLDGDITELWQNYFSVAWKEKPAPLAGVTERPALFMLEQLGWQYGMRVFFLAEHELLKNGRWAHHIVRTSTPGIKGRLESAGDTWPIVLADQLLVAPQEVVSKDITPSGAAMAASLNEPTKLYSWIIAPKIVRQHI